jgi:hypothetical protein
MSREQGVLADRRATSERGVPLGFWRRSHGYQEKKLLSGRAPSLWTESNTSHGFPILLHGERFILVFAD